MYAEIPIWLSLAFIAAGLALLAWSSDVFVDGAARLAKLLGISPIVVGMVIIGFGTSAPELCVSALSAMSGHANLSLGNAYGSCIFNIAVILGVSVMIFPLVVRPGVIFVAGPSLTAISLFSIWLLKDGACSRTDAWILIGLFLFLLPAYCWFEQATRGAALVRETPEKATAKTVASASAKLVVGLGVLVGSSHILVWGSVDFARFVGISDLVIGLTIVAVGTSLPELASAIASARRGEHEFVLGNIIGSNLFNTLAVVGMASAISPGEKFSPYILSRDLPLMALLSASIFFFGVNRRNPRNPGAIVRREAVVWLAVYVVYSVVMFFQEVGKNG